MTDQPLGEIVSIKNTNLMTRSFNFHLSKYNAPIIISLETGEITFPEGMELSEVSKEIWQGIQKLAGGSFNAART